MSNLLSVGERPSERRSSAEPASFFQHVADAKRELEDATLTPTGSIPTSPELASDNSRDSISSLESPASIVSPNTAAAVADSFVFAFDIDGVLVRGGEAIPEAIQAMKVLDGENEYNIQV